MLLMSVSDVVLTMVPDVTNIWHCHHCECGLSMAKSIPGMPGRMAYACFGPEISPSATFQITNYVCYG